MSPRIKLLLFGGLASLLAIWSGNAISNGRFFFPVLIGVTALLIIMWRLNHQPADINIAGLCLAGYLIGNRGFAQVSYPGLPLFPGEFLLLVGGLLVLVRNTREGTGYLFGGGLAKLLLLWIIYSGVRCVMDFRSYGFLAIRDFAVVYYATFFFLARDWARIGRPWLERALLAGLALAPLTFELFRWREDWLTRHVQFLGNPLIFIKSDSAAGLMAGGAAWCACLAWTRRHWAYTLLSLALLTSVMFSNSRAALVSVVFIAGWLMVARAWPLLRVAALYLSIGVLLAASVTLFTSQPWHENIIYRTYERFVSMVDFSGHHQYRSTALLDKADNNDFRLVWWKLVLRETWTTNRWFGLGFGYDLQSRFVEVYYPTDPDDFSTRSPHNVLLTIFGRTGLIGAILFGGVMLAMIRDTWRLARRGINENLGLQLFAWAILVSACFGVVLEGPMGAVVFWITLGLANSFPERSFEYSIEEIDGGDAQPLPKPAPSA